MEHFPAHGKTSATRYIVLTDNVFMLFEPKQKKLDQVLLVAWSFLYSLVKVKLTKGKFVQLSWRGQEDVENSCEQTLEVFENAEELVGGIVEKMQKLGGIKVRSLTESSIAPAVKGELKEEDVTVKAMAQLDINKINENIALCESSMGTELSVSAVQTLMLLYQKAIEYYSALDDPVHHIYVKKLQDLLQTKEVQHLLASPSKEEKRVQEEDIVSSLVLVSPAKKAAEPKVDVPPPQEQKKEDAGEAEPKKGEEDAGGAEPKKGEAEPKKEEEAAQKDVFKIEDSV